MSHPPSNLCPHARPCGLDTFRSVHPAPHAPPLRLPGRGPAGPVGGGGAGVQQGGACAAGQAQKNDSTPSPRSLSPAPSRPLPLTRSLSPAPSHPLSLPTHQATTDKSEVAAVLTKLRVRRVLPLVAWSWMETPRALAAASPFCSCCSAARPRAFPNRAPYTPRPASPPTHPTGPGGRGRLCHF